MRGCDIGRYLTAFGGKDRAIGRNHAEKSEQPTVLDDKTGEVSDQRGNTGLVQHGIDGAGLLCGAENRAADQTQEVRALVQHLLDIGQIGGNGIEHGLLIRKLEQSRRITASHTGNRVIR